ncbi:hypothetical protein ACJRO7_016611 [Eucalyptus globulus]|uniref:Uncharacterized protein n=1 Tax=Eucalyptus globulus TaxID=34317 RepID=A0ABD3L8F5_EUCGL
MASRTIATLLIVAFVVSFAPTATAQQPQNLRRCLSSIRSVIGCPVEIARALFNPQGSVIGPSCCAVIDGCILLVFPSVGAQSIIKSICALGGAPSPTPGRKLVLNTI